MTLHSRRSVMASLVSSFLIREETQAKQPAWSPHWMPDSHVRVIDRTDSSWAEPVQAGLATWKNDFPELTFTYEGTDGQTGFVDGAIVITNPYLNTGVFHGRTLRQYTKEGYFKAILIEFDDADYAGQHPWPEDKARESLMCHEFGHGLGLPHTPDGTGGCMATDRLDHGDPPYPSDYTLSLLTTIYRTTPATPKKGRKKHHRRHNNHHGHYHQSKD